MEGRKERGKAGRMDGDGMTRNKVQKRKTNGRHRNEKK